MVVQGNGNRRPVVTAHISLAGKVVVFILFLLFSGKNVSAADAGNMEPAGQKLSLVESLRIAEKNSAAMKQLPLQKLSAELARKNLALDNWPTLNVSLAYEIGDKIVEQHEYGQFKPYLTLSQEIFGAFDTKFEKHWSSLKDTMDVDIGTLKVKRELYLEVAGKYYNLLLAQMKFDQESQSVTMSRLDVDEANRKFSDGLIAKVDVVRAEAGASLSLTNRLSAMNNLEYARSDFIGVLNLPGNTEVATESLEDVSVYSLDFDPLKRYVETHNSELKIYDKVVEQLPQYREMAGKINWPTVSASVFFGEGGQFSGNEEEDNYGLQIVITKSLYDYGIKGRKREILELQTQLLQRKLSSTKDNYFKQLVLLLKKFNHAGLIAEQLGKQAEQDHRLADIAKRSFELGVSSYTEMLRSRQIAQQGDFRYAEAKVNYLFAEISLKLSAGVTSIPKLFDRTPQWLKEQ